MNQEDIIRMAREAGLHRQQHNLMSNPVQYRFSYDGYEENLERFATLVAAAEREACAKVCEELYDKFSDDPDMVRLKARHAFVLDDCAAAIRARSNT